MRVARFFFFFFVILFFFIINVNMPLNTIFLLKIQTNRSPLKGERSVDIREIEIYSKREIKREREIDR